MTTSRFLCPLDCGWHHEHNLTEPINPTAIHFYDTQPPTEALDPAAWVLSQMRTEFVEGLLREHCATHELVEWVQALQTAKQHVADEKARQEAYEESVVGALNERNIRDCRRADAAEAQVARVRNFLEDMAGWCSPRDVYALRGLEVLDGVDPLGLAGPTREQLAEGAPQRYGAGDFLRAPTTGETPTLSREFDADIELPELTREDAVEAMQDMAGDLYKAEDRLAFIAEMCDAADREQRQVTTEQVRAWTQYTGCGGVLRLPDEVMPLLREFAASESVATPATQASAPDPTAEERQQDALAHTHNTETDHWGGRWAWRCDGHQHCTGDISLGHLTQEAAASSYLRHVDECHGTEPTEKQLHARRACPGWEYDTTEGPRKTWDDVDRTPEGDGWERNVDAGRDGWERFDYTEESYWRRRTAAGEQR